MELLFFGVNLNNSINKMSDYLNPGEGHILIEPGIKDSVTAKIFEILAIHFSLY